MKPEGYLLLQRKENRNLAVRKRGKGPLLAGGVDTCCRFGVLTVVNCVTAVV